MKSRTTRTRAVGLVAAVGLTAAIGSAATAGASADEDVTITFLTHWAPETVALLEDAAAAYHEANPAVTVEVNAVPFGDLLTTIRSQTGSSAPTISGIYDLWLPELVRDGLLAPAPEAVATEVTDNWSASTSSAATVDGSVYGVPNEVNLYALNYNKRLFEEAGIDGPPETWEELIDIAEQLTVRDGDTITQQGFGLINSWAAGVVHPFSSLLLSNGGQLIVDGAPALDSPEATETFELYAQLVGEGGVTDATMGTADANTTGPFLDNFVSGKTAMIIMANWWQSALEAGMGDSFGDIATAPIPVGPSGETASSVSYSWMTVVSGEADEAQQAAAWDFLTWLNGPDSGEEGASAMGGILRSMGILPSRTSDVAAYEDELGSEFLAGYVSQLESAQPFPIVLGGQEFTEALQLQLEALQFGQVDAAGAQETAQSDAVSILEAAAG